MRQTIRFSPAERAVTDAAEKIMADPDATVGEKMSARKTYHQILRDAQHRFLRRRSRREAGKVPVAQAYENDADYRRALDAYRDKIEKLVAEEKLLDPAVSLNQRTLARKILREVEARDLKRGIPTLAKTIPASEPRAPRPPVTPAPTKSDAARDAYLASLGKSHNGKQNSFAPDLSANGTVPVEQAAPDKKGSPAPAPPPKPIMCGLCLDEHVPGPCHWGIN